MDTASRETNVEITDGEGVWSWRPDAGAELAQRLPRLAGDGARKPGPRGRTRNTPLKPLRRERPMIWLNLW
jgi:hypothetical protein